MANEENSHSAVENNVTSFDSCPPQMDNTQSDDESTENRVSIDEQESAIAGDPSSTPYKRFRPPRTVRRPLRYLQ